MKDIALVLSGGGAKGAYQVGVWKALVECGIDKRIDTISATSIGAINAVLFTSYDINNIESFWSNISRANIAPIQLKTVIDMVKRRSICKKDNLIILIRQALNRYNLGEANVKILVTCSNLKWGIPKKEIFELNKDIGKCIDIIAASCSIPCVYKHHKIDGYGMYFDGGINARTPIKSLKKNKYKCIIVVHNDNFGRLNPYKYMGRNVINIYPSSFQGIIFKGTYGFKKELIEDKIQKGYRDTLKIINRIDKVINEKIH